MQKGTCRSTDDAIPRDRNMIKKETDKIMKHKELYSTNTNFVEYKKKKKQT